MLLAQKPDSNEFNAESFEKLVSAAEGLLAPLAAVTRLLKKDISWGRLGANDFTHLHELLRRLTVRANGMAFYFRIVNPKDKFPGTPTPAASRASTPLATPATSRAPSPASREESVVPSNASQNSGTRRRKGQGQSHHTGHRHHKSHISVFLSAHHPSSLFQEALVRSAENPVGVFESQRYLNLETRMTHPQADAYLTDMLSLLSESSNELLTVCADTIDHIAGWFERVNNDRFWRLHRRDRTSREDLLRGDEEARKRLQSALDEFKEKKRYDIYS